MTPHEVALPELPEFVFPMHAQPTPVQQKAINLMGANAARLLTTSRTD